MDGEGNAYITGSTFSTNFFTRLPIQANLGGNVDAFVTKINSDGNAVYSTYLGGFGLEYGNGIAVDAEGNAYITGTTGSPNFPIEKPYQKEKVSGIDAFVSKINANGSLLLYSTYLGGSDDDHGSGIAVDGAGAAYITGRTNSTNFPIVKPYQKESGGGDDIFVTKINALGNVLYSTYLGGSGDDEGNGIAVDGAGSAYITGRTGSENFPTILPIQSKNQGINGVFATKINSDGKSLIYSTGAYAQGSGIAVDGAGSAYITGWTLPTFPTAIPIQPTYAGGFSDAFVTKITDAPLLTIKKVGSGIVKSEPSGIDCGTTCANYYLLGKQVKLKPEPSSGFFFIRFTGDAGCEKGVVTMNGNISCTAIFEVAYTLTIKKSGTGAGLVTSDPSGIDCGIDCAEVYLHDTLVTLIPQYDQTTTGFKGFSGDKGCGDKKITMNSNKTCIAQFKKNPVLTVITIGDYGRVMSLPSGMACGNKGTAIGRVCVKSYQEGSTVKLFIFMLHDDYTFDGWYGIHGVAGCDSVSKKGECLVLMDRDRTIRVRFFPLQALTVQKEVLGINDMDSGTITAPGVSFDCGAAICTGLSRYGTMVKLKAQAAAKYLFDGWDVDGSFCQTPNTPRGECKVLLVEDEPIIVTAKFLPPKELKVSVTVVGTASGRVAGFAGNSTTSSINCGNGTNGGKKCIESYRHGTTVTLKAVPLGKSKFSGWEGKCLSFGKTPTCKIIMDEFKDVKATFQ